MVILFISRVLISPCWTSFIISTARTRITLNLNLKWTCPLVSIILPVLCSMMPKVNNPCRFIYCTWTDFIQQSFVISDGFKSFQVWILWKWFVSGFLEKNRDTFSQDAMNLLQTSKFKYLLTLFKGDFSMVKEFTFVFFLCKTF